MADNKSSRGAADRRQVSGGEGYEVAYFPRKHGISKEQAEALIKRVSDPNARENVRPRRRLQPGTPTDNRMVNYKSRFWG